MGVNLTKEDNFEKEKGMGLIKKVVLIAIVILVLLYFFKRSIFNSIVDYVLNLFR